MPVFHRRGPNRHGLIQPSPRQHKPADMLRKMPRQPHHLPRHRDRPPQQRIFGVQPRLRQPVIPPQFIPRIPALRRQLRGDLFRQPQHLRGLADRRFRPVMDHRRRDRRPVPAISFVKILNYFLAPLMLEIHVDIRRLLALRRDEPLEQQIDLCRIDRRYSQNKTNRRIRRRPPSLAKYFFVPREPHHIMNRQKIPRIFQFGDQPQLFFKYLPHELGYALRVAPRRALPCQYGKIFVRRKSVRHRLIRIFIGNLFQRKFYHLQNIALRRNRLRIFLEQPGHFLRRLQMPFAMRFQPVPGFLDRAMMPDAPQHILHNPRFRRMIQHIIRRDHLAPRPPANLRDPPQPRLIIRRIPPNQRDKKSLPPFPRRPPHKNLKRLIQHRRRHGDKNLPLTKLPHIRVCQIAIPLRRPVLPHTQQPAQPPPRRAVRRITNQIRRIPQPQPAARQKPYPRRLRRPMPAHDPRHRVDIGDPNRRMPQHLGRRRHRLRRGCPFQKTEAGRS